MNYRTLTAAIQPLSRLMGERPHIAITAKLRKLAAAVNAEMAFFGEMSREVVKRHSIPDGTEADDFTAEAKADFKELFDMEITSELPKVEIPLTENIQISVADMQALEGFVEFVE